VKLSERKRRAVDGQPVVVAQPAGQAPVPPPVSVPEAPAPVEPVAASADAPLKRRGMTEDRARRLARDRNAERQPGEPIWTAYRLDPPDGRTWDVGTVPMVDLGSVMPVRDFEEI
jgi:hypothetical protein